ncbi:GPP34 family phosphoprotein [Amycolatopsis sp., V23-08]|uniref:GPP34 family phosphoprotein n=1 Tax=Amycolatopsis heterodermiae TaxID=3110235 RepID=A0ABU5RIZ8_9PSEU|nr:GPP34 family phosphoprotein [Amycolatopsis sp., V23-08]MEA5365539.1 GPP34 family phosphoprotein [Amycolatopsis sp., V23-08]
MRRLTLVDSFFFLGHDEFTGRAVLGRTSLGIGLAGAVLCDLLFTDRITVEDRKVRPITRRLPGIPTMDRAFSEILSETAAHGVRDWIDHLRATLPSITADNLISLGLVRRAPDRVLLRRTHRYPPADLLVSTAARSRARSAVFGVDRPDPHSACLALLAWTAGVSDLCEPELGRAQVRAWMADTHEALPRRIADVITGVEAVAAAVVYTGDRK